jgi:hypothetical protein
MKTLKPKTIKKLWSENAVKSKVTTAKIRRAKKDTLAVLEAGWIGQGKLWILGTGNCLAWKEAMKVWTKSD